MTVRWRCATCAAARCREVIRVAPELPAALPLWAVAAVAGGFLGAELGSRRLGSTGIQRALALVLAVAGVKMIATA